MYEDVLAVRAFMPSLRRVEAKDLPARGRLFVYVSCTMPSSEGIYTLVHTHPAMLKSFTPPPSLC